MASKHEALNAPFNWWPRGIHNRLRRMFRILTILLVDFLSIHCHIQTSSFMACCRFMCHYPGFLFPYAQVCELSANFQSLKFPRRGVNVGRCFSLLPNTKENRTLTFFYRKAGQYDQSLTLRRKIVLEIGIALTTRINQIRTKHSLALIKRQVHINL
ncbi:hypothetical protein BC832DRAFT_419827 [Gaertneriomyces semiglobifer]|nr:hypothetical protein BC832DRAFT_419827 [Gaertneriomyces semiglobifer]